MKNNIKYVFSLLICIILFISGCTFSPDSSDNLIGLNPEKQVELIHKQNLQYILDGNAKAIANAFSENYRDMGGGINGDGTTNMHIVDFWKNVFSDDNFDDFSDKSIEEFVDLVNIQIYTYPNVEEKYYNFICANTRINFNCEKGDLFIFFPPTKDSLLFDGWFGVYRKINNEWKIIAGD